MAIIQEFGFVGCGRVSRRRALPILLVDQGLGISFELLNLSEEPLHSSSALVSRLRTCNTGGSRLQSTVTQLCEDRLMLQKMLCFMDRWSTPYISFYSRALNRDLKPSVPVNQFSQWIAHEYNSSQQRAWLVGCHIVIISRSHSWKDVTDSKQEVTSSTLQACSNWDWLNLVLS